jgi:hypothetical protein
MNTRLSDRSRSIALGRRFELRPLGRFVIAVDSQFYPQIGLLYRRRIQAWALLNQVAEQAKGTMP